MAAFRQMALHAAKQVGAQFVLVDMGPSTDDVNRTLATSADVIQPCACPDSYSWSGAMRLFTDVMPAWMGWCTQHKLAESQSGTNHKYNKTFPRIMPFMAMQVNNRLWCLMYVCCRPMFLACDHAFARDTLPASVKRHRFFTDLHISRAYGRCQ